MPAQSLKFRCDIRPVLATGVLLGVGTVLTFASFTDTDTASALFTTGTVNLTLDAPGSQPQAWTRLGMENAKPGDVTYAPLVVANAGSLDFTYDMSTTAVGDDALAAALQVTIVSGAPQCDATNFADGTEVLAESSLSDAALVNRALAADPATVTDETLCFKVELPSAVDNDLQDAVVNVYFKFNATQAA